MDTSGNAWWLTKNSRKAHRASCLVLRFAFMPLPWRWAGDLPLDYLKAKMEEDGVHEVQFCRLCCGGF